MNKQDIFPILRQFELFQEVPDFQLLWLIEHASMGNLKEGELVFKPGEPIEQTIFVLKGEYRLYRTIGKQEKEISRKSVGDVSGFLPFSRAGKASGVGRVVKDCAILQLHKSNERELIGKNYELTQCLVHEMTNRVRQFTSQQLQTEKLAALGKLSAGLAHELNNPASAIVRSSLALRHQVRKKPNKLKQVTDRTLKEGLIDQINAQLFSKIENPPPVLPLMKRKALEDSLIDLLESYGIEEPEELAESLVDFGFDEAEVTEVIAQMHLEDVPVVLNWMGDHLQLEKIIADIYEASVRISKLVQSVKIHTHMDQAPEKTKGNLESGIENTLQMLGYKLRKQKVLVHRSYADNPPQFPFYISEMNQVWTNLIDNAIDAIEKIGSPEIRIETSYTDEEAEIRISDNGEGISPDSLFRIWEPFFTTKDVGKGTGLGLEVVRDIVERHGGSVAVQSRPGETTFTVLLPLT